VSTGVANAAIRPNLPTASDWTQDDAQKITYYTPRFSGVQLGASYIGDTNNGSTAIGGANPVNGGGFVDVFAGGINYEGNVSDNVGIEAALTGEYGRSDTLATEDLRAWSAGIGANFSGFSVATSYTDQGDSGTTAGDDNSFWTLGGAYENGPFGLSATYLKGEAETAAVTNEYQLLSLGADYQLAPGFVPYVEATFFDVDGGVAPGNAEDNGNVILVGTQLTF
jgi:outer membrane protein OmpU